MPIDLTYKQINDTTFMNAVGKLARHETWKDAKMAYNVAKIARRLKDEGQLAQELFIKMVKQFAKLDEKGNILPPESRPNGFDIKEGNEKSFEEAMKNFETVAFQIDCHKMPMEKLEQVELSAIDLNALEPMLIPVDLSSGL